MGVVAIDLATVIGQFVMEREVAFFREFQRPVGDVGGGADEDMMIVDRIFVIAGEGKLAIAPVESAGEA
jgi:hypothetical protein